jgi:hypothetical protein
MRWVSGAGWRTLVGTVIPKEKIFIPEVGEIVGVMKKLMSIQVAKIMALSTDLVIMQVESTRIPCLL